MEYAHSKNRQDVPIWGLIFAVLKTEEVEHDGLRVCKNSG